MLATMPVMYMYSLAIVLFATACTEMPADDQFEFATADRRMAAKHAPDLPDTTAAETVDSATMIDVSDATDAAVFDSGADAAAGPDAATQTDAAVDAPVDATADSAVEPSDSQASDSMFDSDTAAQD